MLNNLVRWRGHCVVRAVPTEARDECCNWRRGRSHTPAAVPGEDFCAIYSLGNPSLFPLSIPLQRNVAVIYSVYGGILSTYAMPYNAHESSLILILLFGYSAPMPNEQFVYFTLADSARATVPNLAREFYFIDSA